MNRPIIWSVLLSLSACHLGGSSHDAPSVENAQRVPEVEVVRLAPTELANTVHVTGTAVAIEAAGLASPAGATTTDVLVSPGDVVRKGEALVRYRNERVSAGRLQAESSALAAEAQAAYAESELERLAPLAERGTIAPAQIDQLRTQAAAARAQANAARSAERSAAAAAADLVVKAPFDGTVTSVSAQLGETANGAPGVRMADLRTLELEVAVHERDLSRVQVGGEAEVHFPNFGVTTKGTVSWVSMEIDRQTRTASVVATIDNRELHVPSGAYAEATLHAASGREGLVLPVSALGGDDADPFVWVVDEQRASRRSVQVRPLRDGLAEVVEGLEPGQLVVARRTTAVSEGPVQIRGGAL